MFIINSTMMTSLLKIVKIKDMYTQVIILFITSLLICFRAYLPVKLKIWNLMLIGTVFSILFSMPSISTVFSSIQWDVIFYLTGVFLVVEEAEKSHFLTYLINKIFSGSNGSKQVLALIIFALGGLSAIALNDTTAIIGVPIIIRICKNRQDLITPYMLALAFSVTVGSVMTPIGNPQNLLIATQSGMQHQFLNFIKYLGIPTVICLGLTYLIIIYLFSKTLRKEFKPHFENINFNKDFNPSIISVLLFLMLLITKIVLNSIPGPNIQISFGVIAVVSAIPVLLFSKNRVSNIKKMDWGTIVFFVSMFILIGNVWNSGFFQDLINRSSVDVSSMNIIFASSIGLSQIMSNVPLVTLYMPILSHCSASTFQYMALAAASTIAGNIYILGAASTIIIIQNSEKKDRGKEVALTCNSLPSEPYVRFSRIRLSSQQLLQRD